MKAWISCWPFLVVLTVSAGAFWLVVVPLPYRILRVTEANNPRTMIALGDFMEAMAERET
jgi:hypothetical protein